MPPDARCASAFRRRAEDTPGRAVHNGRCVRGVVRPIALRTGRSGGSLRMLFPDIYVAAGTVTLAIWQSAILAGLLILLLFLAIYRAEWPTIVGPAIRLGLALFGIVGAWTLLDRLAERDRADERRAFDQRILEMSARAVAP